MMAAGMYSFFKNGTRVRRTFPTSMAMNRMGQLAHERPDIGVGKYDCLRHDYLSLDCGCGAAFPLRAIPGYLCE